MEIKDPFILQKSVHITTLETSIHFVIKKEREILFTTVNFLTMMMVSQKVAH
ncbi:hypothetical protein SDC9_35359 [bioreactor metagenome]|uniref:Uncharacterized protein n=1 Tax=bioreactor metagenome TaxID=1076179 RepID=A0A644VDV0_9ZZZZ